MEGDLGAIRDFALLAEELGFTHLRIPEQIMRPGNGYLHESMTLFAWLAGFTSKIELVPSVIILPNRQTVLFAKQAAQLDVMTGGRFRIGVGVGNNEEEYGFLGVDFHTRGRRCTEQMQLLKKLWTEEQVEFQGEFDQVSNAGLNPLQCNAPSLCGSGLAPCQDRQSSEGSANTLMVGSYCVTLQTTQCSSSKSLKRQRRSTEIQL